MAKLTLGFISAYNERVEPLMNGTVQAEGIELIPTYSHPAETFWRQLKFGEFEVAEMSMSSFLIAKSQGSDMVALPVFPSRRLFHTEISYHTDSGIKKPEDLKGKKIGVSRIGGNSHYFTVQALRRFGMDANRDVQFIQTGGDPETFAAFVSGQIDVANLTPPTDAVAIAKGYHYVIYGPDLKIPYAATAFVTKRSVIAKRPQVVGNFMRAMAETAKLMHTDREFVYKVLGKYLRVTDRAVLDSAYNAEIKVLEPRLAIKADSLQAILDELAGNDPRAKKIKPQEMIDSRYLDEMEKSGFFDQLWAKK